MPRVVTFGELMLRLTPPGHLRLTRTPLLSVDFGGAEANVAVSVARFGLASQYVTRMPANPLGDAAIDYLRSHGVRTETINRGGERIGIYFLEHGATQRPSQVVYDRAGSAIATAPLGCFDWPSILKGARWFHTSGITPAISEAGAREAIAAASVAREAGVVVSVDLNFRSRLWGWGGRPEDVMHELVDLADVIIGNEEDAEKVFGISAPTPSASPVASDYAGVTAALRSRFPRVRVVALTIRGSVSASHNRWTGIADEDGRVVTGPMFDVAPIIDRVGAGDAFAAGLIFSLCADRPLEDALAFAVAAGCLKHSIPGDANIVSVDDVDQLVRDGGHGRIRR